jgi:hypothetical protein
VRRGRCRPRRNRSAPVFHERGRPASAVSVRTATTRDRHARGHAIRCGPCRVLRFDADVAPIHVRGATKWRPYGTVGFGVIRAWLDSTDDQLDTHQQNPAFNVGGGVMYWLRGASGYAATCGISARSWTRRSVKAPSSGTTASGAPPWGSRWGSATNPCRGEGPAQAHPV